MNPAGVIGLLRHQGEQEEGKYIAMMLVIDIEIVVEALIRVQRRIGTPGTSHAFATLNTFPDYNIYFTFAHVFRGEKW